MRVSNLAVPDKSAQYLAICTRRGGVSKSNRGELQDCSKFLDHSSIGHDYSRWCSPDFWISLKYCTH